MSMCKKKSWDSIFGRGSASSLSKNATDAKKAKRDQSDPHVCLLCGSELVRGTRSYKERHFLQQHKKEKLDKIHELIVPKHHEKAVQFLKSKEHKQGKAGTAITSSQIDVSCARDSLCEALDDDEFLETSVGIPQSTMQESANSSSEESSNTGMQTCLNRFFGRPVDSEGPESNKSTDKMQSDINRLLVMVESLVVQKSATPGTKSNPDAEFTTNLERAKSSSSLVELQQCNHLEITVLSDGCRITCMPCNRYMSENPLLKLSAQENSWGRGLLYSSTKYEKLMDGHNQDWFSFKNHLILHLGCNSIRAGGQAHFKALEYAQKVKQRHINDVTVNTKVVACGIETCKMKAAAIHFESLLSLMVFCGVDVGKVGHGRKLFPDVMKAGAIYCMRRAANYLQQSLPNTGLPPHFSVAVDKSTPHRDTNQAIMIIVPYLGKRVAMPIDCPEVYRRNAVEMPQAIVGGTGQQLARQIFDVLSEFLKLSKDGFAFLRGVHADGQYQSSTFQCGLRELVNEGQVDSYFCMAWDSSHWLDLAVVKLRDDSRSSSFMKLLVKRANRFHIMFGRGRGHTEYKGVAADLNLVALDTTTYATTRFSSSAMVQWEKIYKSYNALIEAFIENRETADPCEETKYLIRGQDFAIDLCGALDILNPVKILMEKTQSLQVPPWKIQVWIPRLLSILENMSLEITQMQVSGKLPNLDILPKLGKHWEELSRKEGSCSFHGVEVLAGWVVVNQSQTGNDLPMRSRKRTSTVSWESRFPEDCLNDLQTLAQEMRHLLAARCDKVEAQTIGHLKDCLDLEFVVNQFSEFSLRSGKLQYDREKWEVVGQEQFGNFFRDVCSMSHIKNLMEQNDDLDFIPLYSSKVYQKFKNTLRDMLWNNLGSASSKMFVTNSGRVEIAPSSQLATITPVNTLNLDQWFKLTFSSGDVVVARLDEEEIWKMAYCNKEIYDSLGKEMSICLDIALAASGCEAIVEGFYSIMNGQKQFGGQSNEVLTHRSIVDWCLPHPIASPSTMAEIARIYSEGDSEYKLAKHRSQVLGNSMRFRGKKVISRLEDEECRCPHLLMPE